MRLLLSIIVALFLFGSNAYADDWGYAAPYINITGTNTLGGTTLTAPTINGVVGGTTTSQTITTLTATTANIGTVAGAAITGPAPAACGGTCTVAKSRSTTLLDTAAGSVATLPAATGTGNVYSIIVSTTVSSNADKVLTNPITDVIIGTAIGWTGSTAKVFSGGASTYHSLQMPFAGSQPSGGFAGDTITCTDIASATWVCNITYQGGTTPTTPYSASTS